MRWVHFILVSYPDSRPSFRGQNEGRESGYETNFLPNADPVQCNPIPANMYGFHSGNATEKIERIKTTVVKQEAETSAYESAR
jgi:hypothetical protein